MPPSYLIALRLCLPHEDTSGFWASSCFNTNKIKVFRILDRHVSSVYPLSIGAMWGFRRLVSWPKRFTENPIYYIKLSHWSHNYGTRWPKIRVNRYHGII
jgi:hypothetical protein